jgi:hypothetical protein
MSGEPTAKVVEAMQGMLKLCRAQDTVQVITFASQAFKLFEKPLPVNDENIGKALGFTAGLQGRGGTEMLKGVQMAIDEPIDKERLRIVVMLTDGYIGNEAQIIEHVGKHCGDQIRFWCVGIGSAPNMMLVDGVAKQGGGMGKALGLADESQPLVQEIMTRIQRAQLAKVKIDWGNLKVSETYPAKIPELWAGRPVIVQGRYDQPDNFDEAVIVEQIKISGNVEGEDVSWPLRVELPMTQKANDVLAKVWARQKIEDLMHQTYYHGSPAVEEMVTGIALDYKLMSQYTSFVAVDDKTPPSAEPAKPPRQMLVPVPLPEGTRWEGFFGEREELAEQFAFRFKEADKKQLRELSKSFDRPMLLSRALTDRSVRLALPPAAAAPVGGPGGFGGAGFGTRSGAFRGIAAGGSIPARDEFGRGGRAYFAHDGRRAVAKSLERLSLVNGQALFEAEVAQSAAEGFAYPGLSAQGSKVAEAARKALEQATGKEAPTDRAELRKLLMQACLLDSAAANVGQSDGSVAQQAIAKLRELHDQDVKDWSARLPQLAAKLDLVIRDASLAETLAQVARAAKIDFRLAEGSLADAESLLGRSPRVTFLDLRRATVAQALDWILQPAKLAWSLDAMSIVATSERRRSGESGWIYDVSAIALPLDEDLTKLNDHDKAVAESQKAADEFLAAVKQSLKVDGDTTVLWFAPGQLLVFGNAQRHTAVAAAIGTLEAGQSKPAGALAALSEVTRKRFATRKEKLDKAAAAGRKLDVALAYDRFSWQLLSAAAAGELDLEALTELQIAWKSPQTAELLAGPSRTLLLRSLWCVCEAAHSLPEQQELATLAAAARRQAESAAQAAISAAENDRKDHGALVGVLYAALANPNDRAYLNTAMPLLVAKEGEEAAAAKLRTLCRLLIGQPSEADRASLLEMVSREAAGPDHVVLLALACHKSGGAQWQRFRAESRDYLGGQPLPGDIVVFVNRLDLGGMRLGHFSR